MNRIELFRKMRENFLKYHLAKKNDRVARAVQDSADNVAELVENRNRAYRKLQNPI